MNYDDDPMDAEKDKNKYKAGALGHTVLTDTNVM